jgi:hypothetical protein
MSIIGAITFIGAASHASQVPAATTF